MPLPPLSFTVPQPRPSIIEQAFSVALGTLAGELAGGPFERARERRRGAAELNQMAVRSQLELDQAKKLGDIQFARHIEENYQPFDTATELQLRGLGIADPTALTLKFNDQLYINRGLAERAVLGARPSTDLQQSTIRMIDDFLPGDLPVPKTQEEYTRAVPLLDTMVSAYRTKNEAGLRSDQRRIAAMTALGAFLSNPDLAKYQGAYTRGIQDPTTGQYTTQPRSLTRLEMVALANSGDIEGFSAVSDQLPEVKDLVTRLRQMGAGVDAEGGFVIPVQPSAKVEDILREVNRMRTTDGFEERLGYIPELLRINQTVPLLMWRGKPVPNEASVAAEALSQNQDLLIAIKSADTYGNAQKVLLAERGQLGELPYKAKQYMQYIFRLRGSDSWDLGVAELPGLQFKLRQGTSYTRPPGSSQTAPAATTSAPGVGGATTPLPTSQGGLSQAVVGRAGPRVNMSRDLQGAYSVFYGALQSDPTVYPTVQAKLDSIFSLPREQAAQALESYGWPKTVTDSVRKSDALRNHFRRNMEAALRQVWLDLTNGQEE